MKINRVDREVEKNKNKKNLLMLKMKIHHFKPGQQVNQKFIIRNKKKAIKTIKKNKKQLF